MNLFEKIMSVKNFDLDSIDMSYYPQKYWNSHSQGLPDGGFSRFYSYNSGQDHYRLLNYISHCMEDQVLLDIGTFNGWSSIAMGSNKKNRVVSFDVFQQECVRSINEPNIIFRVENILENEYNNQLILQSPFIFLDTYHDGTFEQQFVERLLNIGYKGVVGFDDIYLNEPMKQFWHNLSFTKYDATSVGHGTGTGIVLFE